MRIAEGIDAAIARGAKDGQAALLALLKYSTALRVADEGAALPLEEVDRLTLERSKGVVELIARRLAWKHGWDAVNLAAVKVLGRLERCRPAGSLWSEEVLAQVGWPRTDKELVEILSEALPRPWVAPPPLLTPPPVIPTPTPPCRDLAQVPAVVFSLSQVSLARAKESDGELPGDRRKVLVRGPSRNDKSVPFWWWLELLWLLENGELTYFGNEEKRKSESFRSWLSEELDNRYLVTAEDEVRQGGRGPKTKKLCLRLLQPDLVDHEDHYSEREHKQAIQVEQDRARFEEWLDHARQKVRRRVAARGTPT